MDAARFDALTKVVARSASRRQVLAALGAALGASLGLGEAARAARCAGPGQACGPSRACCGALACTAGACAPPGQGNGNGGAGGGSSRGCPAGQSRCGGACVALASDPTNCGACGNVCATAVADATATCTNGACGVACGAGYQPCNGACIPTASCCTAADCPGGQCLTCTNHACVTTCGAGQGCCGGACADLTTDANCGACGATCTPPQTCGGGGTAGVCGCTPAPSCPQGQQCGTAPDGCGGTLDCGPCTGGTVCTPVSCQNGLCVHTAISGCCTQDSDCPASLNPCEPATCDTHTNTCVTKPVADNTGCGSGQVCCGGSCVDTQSDAANCGGCGTTCPANTPCASGGAGCCQTGQCLNGGCLTSTASCGSCATPTCDPSQGAICVSHCPAPDACHTGGTCLQNGTCTYQPKCAACETCDPSTGACASTCDPCHTCDTFSGQCVPKDCPPPPDPCQTAVCEVVGSSGVCTNVARCGVECQAVCDPQTGACSNNPDGNPCTSQPGGHCSAGHCCADGYDFVNGACTCHLQCRDTCCPGSANAACCNTIAPTCCPTACDCTTDPFACICSAGGCGTKGIPCGTNADCCSGLCAVTGELAGAPLQTCQ